MLIGFFQMDISYMRLNFLSIVIFQDSENATARIPGRSAILQPDDYFPVMSNLFHFEGRHCTGCVTRSGTRSQHRRSHCNRHEK